MKRTVLALSLVALFAAAEGCGCCRGWFKRRQAVAIPAPAPVCETAPACCPTDPCGGCDSCTGAPYGAYGDPQIQYAPAPSLPGGMDPYGNGAPPPGP